MDGLIGPKQSAIIYQHETVQIQVKREADSAVIDLLKRTTYGTYGVQYQHTGQEVKVHQLKNPFFFCLFQADKLIGLYCLDERTIHVSPGLLVNSFYGRYLSIHEQHQGKGYGRLLKTEAVRYVESHSTTPYIVYAYVEGKNTRSLRIFEREGFTSTATLKTFVFRRYAPKIDSRFNRLAGSEKATLLAKLSCFYAACSFTTFAHIGYQDNYFVLKEGDEIIAGVQANPVCWKFSAMPGLGGWIMMNILPLSSATRRFFNPAAYQFVALEGIYLKEGQEELLATLLESVLAHFGCHSALLQIDVNDPLNALVTDTKKMGPFSGFQKSITTLVMTKASFRGEVSLKPTTPVYISSFDFT